MRWAFASLIAFLALSAFARFVADAPWWMSIAAGAFGGLACLGLGLWRDPAADASQARMNLGTGLLVGILVSGTIAVTQLAAQRETNEREDRATHAADARAERESVRLTVSLRRDLPGIDLDDRDLRGLYLRGKNLRGASLRRTNLDGVDLMRADLSGDARLDGARIRRANLSLTNLEGVHLKAARVSSTDFGGADLSFADARGLVAVRVNLEGATLEQALLAGARFDHAVLARARMVSAQLPRASLVGTTLVAATLRGAELVKADFTRADLRRADLRDAILDQADLRGADLRAARLAGATFREALIDANTQTSGVDLRTRGALMR